MKEVSIECPKCETITKYHRDNFNFYLRLFGFLGVSFSIGLYVGANYL